MYNPQNFYEFVRSLSKCISGIKTKHGNRFTFISKYNHDISFENMHNKINVMSSDVSIHGDSVNIHIDKESNEVFVNVFLNGEIIGDVVFEYNTQQDALSGVASKRVNHSRPKEEPPYLVPFLRIDENGKMVKVDEFGNIPSQNPS